MFLLSNFPSANPPSEFSPVTPTFPHFIQNQAQSLLLQNPAPVVPTHVMMMPLNKVFLTIFNK